tara:strand:- start:2821 stop:12753 length:9933 start_codon:yes stop_codon:yes gene_type:complete
VLENPIEWAWESLVHSILLKSVEDALDEDEQEIIDSALACNTLPLFMEFLEGYKDSPIRLTKVVELLHTVDENGKSIWEDDPSIPFAHEQKRRTEWEDKYKTPYPAKRKREGGISVYDQLGTNEEQKWEIHKALQKVQEAQQQEYYRRSHLLDSWELKVFVNNLVESKKHNANRQSAQEQHEQRGDDYDRFRWEVDTLNDSGKVDEGRELPDGEWVSNKYYTRFQNQMRIQTKKAEKLGEQVSRQILMNRAHENIRARHFRGQRMSNNALEAFMRAIRKRGLFNEKLPYQGDNYKDMSRDEIMQMASAAVHKISQDDLQYLVRGHFDKFVKKRPVNKEMEASLSKDIENDTQKRLNRWKSETHNEDGTSLKRRIHTTIVCPDCADKGFIGCPKCNHGYISSFVPVKNNYERKLAVMKSVIDATETLNHDTRLEQKIRSHTLSTGAPPDKSKIAEFSAYIKKKHIMSEKSRLQKAERKVEGRQRRVLLEKAYEKLATQRAMLDDIFIDITTGVKQQLADEGMTVQDLLNSKTLQGDADRQRAKEWLGDVFNSTLHVGLGAKSGTDLGERRVNKFKSVWRRLDDEPELKRVILGLLDAKNQPLLGVAIGVSSSFGYIDLTEESENLYKFIAKDIGGKTQRAIEREENDNIVTLSPPEQIEEYLAYRDPVKENPYILSKIPVLRAPPLKYRDNERQGEDGNVSSIQKEMEEWMEKNEPLSREEAQLVDITHSLYNYEDGLKRSSSSALTQNDLIAVADMGDVLGSLGFEGHIPAKQIIQAIATAGDRREVTHHMMDLFYLLCNDDGSDKTPDEIVQGNRRLWRQIYDKEYPQLATRMKGVVGEVPIDMGTGGIVDCPECADGKGKTGAGNCSNSANRPGKCFGFYDSQGKPLPPNLRGKLRPTSQAPTEYDENYAPFIEELRKRLKGTITMPDGTEFAAKPDEMKDLQETGARYEPGILHKTIRDIETTLRQNDNLIPCKDCNGTGTFVAHGTPPNLDTEWGKGWSYDAGAEEYSRPCWECKDSTTGKSTGKRPDIAGYVTRLNQDKKTMWALGASMRDEGFGLDDLNERNEARKKIIKTNEEEEDSYELQGDNHEKWGKGIIPKVDGNPHWPFDFHHLMLYPDFHKSDESGYGRLTVPGLKEMRERLIEEVIGNQTTIDANEKKNLRDSLTEEFHTLFSGMRNLGGEFLNELLSDDQADNVMETDYMEELIRLLCLPEFKDELIQNHLDLIHAPDGDGRNSILDPGGWNTQLYCDTCEGTGKQKSIDGHVKFQECPDCVGTGSEGVRRLHEELKLVMPPEVLTAKMLKEAYHNQTLNLTGTRRPSLYSHPDVQHLPSGTGRHAFDSLNSRERGHLFGTTLPSSHSISGIEQLFRHDPGHNNQQYIQNLLGQLQRIHVLRGQMADAYGKNKEMPKYMLVRAEHELENMISSLSESGTQLQIEQQLGKTLDDILPGTVTLDSITDDIYSIPQEFDFEKEDVKSIRCPSCLMLQSQGTLSDKYLKDGKVKTVKDHMDDDDGFCHAAHEAGLDLVETNAMVRYLRLMLDPQAPEYFKKLSRGIDNFTPFTHQLKGYLENLMGQSDTFEVGGIHISNIRKVNPQMLLVSRLQDIGGTNPDNVPMGRGSNYLGISNAGYSESSLHALLNNIQTHFLPDPIDKNGDDKIRRLFAMHVLDPTLGEGYHADVLALPISPEGGWSKESISELHPEDSHLIEWARKSLRKRVGKYALNQNERDELLGGMHSLCPLLALQKRFMEEIEQIPDLKEEMFPGGESPLIFNLGKGDFLDMSMPSDPELPRGLIHDVFSILRDVADKNTRLRAVTGNNQTDYKNLFPYEHNPSMEFIMLAPLEPALKRAWIMHDDETLAKFGDEWVVTGKSLPEIMESGLLDKFWEHHTGGRDITDSVESIGHDAKGVKGDLIPTETKTLSGTTIPRSRNDFMYDGDQIYKEHRDTTDFWDYLITEINHRSRHPESSKRGLLEAAKIGIRSAHNRDGKASRCYYCMGPGHHIDIDQAMQDYGNKHPHIITYESPDSKIGDPIPWPHYKNEYEGLQEWYSPIPSHDNGFERVVRTSATTRQFLVENFSPKNRGGEKGEKIWREVYKHGLEDGLIPEGTDFWKWATDSTSHIECIGCEGRHTAPGNNYTLPKKVRDDMESTLMMSTHFGNLGIGLTNAVEGMGYAPETGIWEPLDEDIKENFPLYAGGMLAPGDRPFFDAEHLGGLYDRLREIQQLLKDKKTPSDRRKQLEDEMINIRRQMDDTSPAITDSEKIAMGLNLDTGAWESEKNVDESQWAARSLDELKGDARKHNLSVTGTKAELIERLKKWQQSILETIQSEKQQKRMMEDAYGEECQHRSCSGDINICPQCNEEKDVFPSSIRLKEQPIYDKGVDTGKIHHTCPRCEMDWDFKDVIQAALPRLSVYGPHMEGTKLENLHGYYCEMCQPKHEAEKDKLRREINMPGDKLWGGLPVLTDVLRTRDKNNYITNDKITAKFGSECTFLGLSRIPNTDRPGNHYVPMFQDIQYDSEGNKIKGIFALGDANLGYMADLGWRGGAGRRAGFHDSPGWDSGGVANGVPWVKTDFETSGGVRGNQYARPSGGKTRCKNCTYELPDWQNYVMQKVLEDNPELGERARCPGCDGFGYRENDMTGEIIDCPKCKRHGSLPHPQLGKAKKAQRKILKGQIECENCDHKTHYKANDFYKSRSLGEPYFFGARKDGSGGVLHATNIHNLNMQDEILQERLMNIVENGVDGIMRPGGDSVEDIQPAVLPCNTCSSMTALGPKLSSQQWREAYEKGKGDSKETFTEWARGKSMNSVGNIEECTVCGGKTHVMGPLSINGNLGTHEPIFTWYRPNFKITVKGQEGLPDVEPEAFRKSIIRRRIKVKHDKAKNIFEETKPEEEEEEKHFLSKLGRLLVTDSSGNFTLPVFRPHPGFNSSIGHKQDYREASESGFRGLPDIKSIKSFIKVLNDMASQTDSAWDKHLAKFYKLVHKFARPTTYSGDFGHHKEHFGLAELIGDMFIPMAPLNNLVKLIEKEKERIKSEGLEGEGLTDESKKRLKDINAFLNYNANLPKMLRGSNETALGQYEIVPVEGNDFMVEDKSASVNTFISDAGFVNHPIAYDENKVKASPAYKALKALEGDSDGKGIPSVGISGEKTVSDDVSPSFLKAIKELFTGATWGWPGRQFREGNRNEVEAGQRANLKTQTSYLPRTVSEEHHSQMSTQKKPGEEDGYAARSQYQQGMDDDKARQEEVDDALSIHSKFAKEDGPITSTHFAPVDTTPQIGAAVTDDSDDDPQKSNSPIDEAWDSILKNLNIIQ